MTLANTAARERDLHSDLGSIAPSEPGSLAFLAVKPSSKWPASREAVEARFCASGGMPMTVRDGPYADLQYWRLEGGDQDFALETGCGMPEQCSSGENAEDVLSQAGKSMSGTIGAAWQQR